MNHQTVRDYTLNQVELQFDWEIPTAAGRATFKVGLERADQSSTVGFEVNLLKLSRAQLRRLESFLAARHAGLTSAAEVAATASWLLDISLAQGQPKLSATERQILVRQLLLAD
jgi:hypothetical protein